MEAEEPQAEGPTEGPPANGAQAEPPPPIGPPTQPPRTASPAAPDGACGGPHWEGKDMWGMYPPLAVLEGEEVREGSQQRQARPRTARGQKKAADKREAADKMEAEDKMEVVDKMEAAAGSAQPVLPAEEVEPPAVAKAMQCSQFGRHVEELFRQEKEAALKALRTGLYVGWRCPEYLWDCFRVGEHSKCFCGHLLGEHEPYAEVRDSVPCAAGRCECRGFAFVPSRPEDVGELWLRRRAPAERAGWHAACRCKHSHEKHAPGGTRACRAAGCPCKGFESTFLCAACDRRWEEHQTFFETMEARKQGGLPYGEQYLVFAELPEMRNAVLTGKTSDDSAYLALLAEMSSPSSSQTQPLPSTEPPNAPK
ncbi:protein FAM221B [Nothoprocta perdicaria]|uniref:protein FAM221B n=1 Tax=Nothoprocta perdicaria TaxID=30464 RepID=UPI000E1B778B|nr:protein FAM221B [Nothoprocta perdicaria]